MSISLASQQLLQRFITLYWLWIWLDFREPTQVNGWPGCSPPKSSKGVFLFSMFIYIHVYFSFWCLSHWKISLKASGQHIANQFSTSQGARKLQKGCCRASSPLTPQQLKSKAPLRSWGIRAVPDHNKNESEPRHEQMLTHLVGRKYTITKEVSYMVSESKQANKTNSTGYEFVIAFTALLYGFLN